MNNALQSGVISHWHHLVDDFTTSAMDFYAGIEFALARRQIPDISVSRVVHKEGGLASSGREYMRIKRGKLAFGVCAATFGNSYFFSWWLVRPGFPVGLVLALLAVVMAVVALLTMFGQIAERIGPEVAFASLLGSVFFLGPVVF